MADSGCSVRVAVMTTLSSSGGVAARAVLTAAAAVTMTEVVKTNPKLASFARMFFSPGQPVTGVTHAAERLIRCTEKSRATPHPSVTRGRLLDRPAHPDRA